MPPRIVTDAYGIVSVGELTPHPRNVNEGDMGAIAESLETLGFYGAVLAQRSSGTILAGKHRWIAAKAAGMTEIPVLWIDADDDEALRIMLGDNRTTRLGHDDEQALAVLLAELATSDSALDGTGWDADDLDDLIAGLAVPDPEPERCLACGGMLPAPRTRYRY